VLSTLNSVLTTSAAPHWSDFQSKRGERTAREIATIAGHASPREIARYTNSADQHQLAVTAIAQVKTGT
jgi:hypothetical protein